jgi:hypothetical protein
VGSNVHEQLKNLHTNRIQKDPEERSSGLSHPKMCGVVSCTTKIERKKGAFHTVALPFTLKPYLKGKRRIMETQIFYHAKNIIFKKSSKRNQNPLRYYYNSSFNTSQNTIFQKSSYKNKPIIT